MAGVRVIDFQGRSAEQLRATAAIGREVDTALGSEGSFLIVGHTVPPLVMSALHEEAERFFARPQAERDRVARPQREEVARGYLCAATPTANMERYTFGAWDVPTDDPYYTSLEGRKHFPRNRFPPDSAVLQGAARVYFEEMGKLSRKVAAVLEVAIGVPAGTFSGMLTGSCAAATLMKYGRLHGAPPGPDRIQAHNDHDFFTILKIFEERHTDLYFLSTENEWILVPAVENAFIVNLGNLMERFTNGRWLATSHRVENPPPDRAHADRYAVAYFEHPAYNTIVEPLEPCWSADDPPRFPPETVADLQRDRRMRIHLARGVAPRRHLAADIEGRYERQRGS